MIKKSWPLLLLLALQLIVITIFWKLADDATKMQNALSTSNTSPIHDIDLGVTEIDADSSFLNLEQP
jgi:hypothetical protein